MSTLAVASQLSATPLGAGRWRVELELEPPAGGDPAGPRPHPREVTLRPLASGAPRCRVESLAVPTPSAPDRFSAVLAAEGSPATRERARFELSGDGWSGEVELTPWEQPSVPGAAIAPASSRPAAIDYRARDFWALRTMLLAVVDERFGPGLADHPVSQTSALIEELAYLGDALSYTQDALATEAYLASARRRISVARHAALLDYQVGQARSARTWVHFEVSEPMALEARTMLLAATHGLPPAVGAAAVRGAVSDGALVFETLEAVSLYPDSRPLRLSPESHQRGRLAAGATAATLDAHHEGLEPGTLVLIEPANAGAPPSGHVVRLTRVWHDGQRTRIEWGRADAVPADADLVQCRVHVRVGNLVLADHGETHDWARLPRPRAGRCYWPELPARRPAFSAGADPRDRRLSAAEQLQAAGRTERAAVELRHAADGQQQWWVLRESLFESGPLDPAYVVEVEDDGSARLRFGDGTNGLRPPVGARFEVRVRSGGGGAGNVGAGSIAHMVGTDARLLSVCNPVPAVGGADPESITAVRLNAPTAFRITDRAVTPEQYTAAALAVDGVADATCVIEPGSSGPMARVRVHAGGWDVPADGISERVRETLERRRPVGVALDVRGATATPATVAVEITPQPGWAPAAVAREVERLLGGGLLASGTFGFGVGLHRSDLVRLLAPLSGVLDVTVEWFDWTDHGLRHAGRERLQPAFGHIIRIDNDPAAPERGSISFRLRIAA